MTDNKTHNNGQANYSHELTIRMSVYGRKRACIYMYNHHLMSIYGVESKHNQPVMACSRLEVSKNNNKTTVEIENKLRIDFIRF